MAASELLVSVKYKRPQVQFATMPQTTVCIHTPITNYSTTVLEITYERPCRPGSKSGVKSFTSA